MFLRLLVSNEATDKAIRDSQFGAQDPNSGRVEYETRILTPIRLNFKTPSSGNFKRKSLYVPMTMAARNETRNVFVCSNTGIVGSNLTRDTDVYPRSSTVCVVL
jgi:hypothetical protein